MEDPIKVNLWGVPLAEHRETVLSAICDQSIYPSPLRLRVAVNKAIHEGSTTEITAALPYHKALEIANSLAGAFTDLTFYQEGYRPSDRSSFCMKHNYHFGGGWGCHICIGFFAT